MSQNFPLACLGEFFVPSRFKMAIDIENIIESLYIQVMYTNYLPGPALQSTGYSHPVSEEAIVAKTNLH